MQLITPFLWFDSNAEEAVNFYISIFKNSKIIATTYYSDAVAEAAGRPKGSVMTVAFRLNGQEFVALNGGPHFNFTEAISFAVNCDSSEEVDYYWDKLTADGGEESQCGWLKDKYGLSWQVVPREMIDILNSGDKEKAARVTAAIMTMKKLDLNLLRKAAEAK